jgi:hypothetical protein
VFRAEDFLFRPMGLLDLVVSICCLVGKDIVFRFIIEYSSLMDFGLYVVDLFLYEDF